MNATIVHRNSPSRWWLLLVAMVLFVAGAVMWLHDDAEDDVAVKAATVVDEQAAAMPPAPAAQGESVTPVSSAGGVAGEAAGMVRIEADNAAPFELRTSQGVGVWQPAQRRLRIALTGEALDYVRATHLLDTLAGEGMAARDGAPPAMLEIVFSPTAQGFAQDELTQATLTVRDARGRLVKADVLNSMSWNGSLPAAELAVAGQTSQVEMKLNGTGFSADNPGMRPSWNLSLSVPVGVRQ